MWKALKILWELAKFLNQYWPEDSKFNNEKELAESLAKYLMERVEARH